MWDKALEIASRVNHPISLAAVTCVLVAIGLFRVTRARKSGGLLAAIALLILGSLGLAPLLTSTYVQARGIYHVRAIVLGADKVPVENAHLTSSGGGEPKKVEGGWEFDIPPQSRPADGIVVIYAAVSSAFLTGNSAVKLGKDYYPTTTIQLSADTSAIVRGTAVDQRHRISCRCTRLRFGICGRCDNGWHGQFPIACSCSGRTSGNGESGEGKTLRHYLGSCGRSCRGDGPEPERSLIVETYFIPSYVRIHARYSLELKLSVDVASPTRLDRQ